MYMVEYTTAQNLPMYDGITISYNSTKKDGCTLYQRPQPPTLWKVKPMSKTMKNSATPIIAPKTAEHKSSTQESRITVADFKRYIDSRDVKRVIYSTENQDYYNPFTPIKYELQFDGIVVSAAPSMHYVYLGQLPHGKHSNMMINRIRYVRIEYSIFGDVVHLYCGSGKRGDTYKCTILVQYE